MTGRDDLDRELAAYFEGQRTVHAPEGILDAARAGIQRTRQRPAWLVLNRWLPDGVRHHAGRTLNVAILITTVALLVALAIGIGILVGSRPRLPRPFGLATPGLITFDLGGRIYVAHPDGTGSHQLTAGVRGDGGPTWSPDGMSIAYQSQQGDLSSAVIVIDASGGHGGTIADHLAQVGDISWAPDSRRVTFSARLVGSHLTHLYVAGIDHPGAMPLGAPDLVGEEPSWSPDGRQIAFKRISSCCGPTVVPDSLWLIGVDGSNLHPLWVPDHVLVSGNNDLWNTAWSPDGTHLAFLTYGVGGKFDVYFINADGSGERDITNSPEDEFWPSWSPDGRRIAFPRMWSNLNNAGSLVVGDPDGSHQVVLTGPYVNSNAPVWSPDGNRVIGYAKNPDLAVDVNSAVAIFDPSNRTPPTLIPAAAFNSATWQRLAP